LRWSDLVQISAKEIFIALASPVSFQYGATKNLQPLLETHYSLSDKAYDFVFCKSVLMPSGAASSLGIWHSVCLA
jgi:hypothetical protein